MSGRRARRDRVAWPHSPVMTNQLLIEPPADIGARFVVALPVQLGSGRGGPPRTPLIRERSWAATPPMLRGRLLQPVTRPVGGGAAGP